MSHSPQIVSVKQLAELLSVSVDTVYRMAAAGTVPSLRTTPRGRWRFLVDDVLAALAEHNKAHPADQLPRRPGRPRLRLGA
jgi:excisionase family DNA binding protein